VNKWLLLNWFSSLLNLSQVDTTIRPSKLWEDNSSFGPRWASWTGFKGFIPFKFCKRVALNILYWSSNGHWLCEHMSLLLWTLNIGHWSVVLEVTWFISGIYWLLWKYEQPASESLLFTLKSSCWLSAVCNTDLAWPKSAIIVNNQMCAMLKHCTCLAKSKPLHVLNFLFWLGVHWSKFKTTAHNGRMIPPSGS